MARSGWRGWLTAIRSPDLYIKMSPAILFSSQGTFFFSKLIQARPCFGCRDRMQDWILRSWSGKDKKASGQEDDRDLRPCHMIGT